MREQAGNNVCGEKQNEAGSKILSLSTVRTTAAIAARQEVVSAIILGPIEFSQCWARAAVPLQVAQLNEAVPSSSA